MPVLPPAVAPVRAGHDAAARGVAAELRARGADVEIDDGLDPLGRVVHRLVWTDTTARSSMPRGPGACFTASPAPAA
jgi:hypothetical protein